MMSYDVFLGMQWAMCHLITKFYFIWHNYGIDAQNTYTKYSALKWNLKKILFHVSSKE